MLGLEFRNFISNKSYSEISKDNKIHQTYIIIEELNKCLKSLYLESLKENPQIDYNSFIEVAVNIIKQYAYIRDRYINDFIIHAKNYGCPNFKSIEEAINNLRKEL